MEEQKELALLTKLRQLFVLFSICGCHFTQDFPRSVFQCYELIYPNKLKVTKPNNIEHEED